MNPNSSKRRRGIARKFVPAAAVFAVAWFISSAPALAQTPNPPNRYPTMAPLEQYLMADRDAEIVLARSGAPDAIPQDAEVRVLTRHGYDTVAQGKNGFVCMALRSWTAAPDDPVFWNPKIRGPVCMNAIATRSYLRLVQKKAAWCSKLEIRASPLGTRETVAAVRYVTMLGCCGGPVAVRGENHSCGIWRRILST
jgi:hypothetical protein